MSARNIWFDIRSQILNMGMKQVGPNLFSYNGKSAVIYTFSDYLSIETVIDLVSKVKSNSKLSLPLYIIVESSTKIDPACENYQNIMKKELKICSINEFNV